MKKILTAFLPFILLAQLPIQASKFVPAEWMKSFQYGVKWTELMVNGYPGTSDQSLDTIPEGKVTTTVVMASAVAEPEALAIPVECSIEIQQRIAEEAIESARMQMKLHEIRLREIRTVRLIQM